MSDKNMNPPVQATLKSNSVGLAGAVIMSAAIMGPAVSTFFNPQFSTPFSGPATPFVYFACLIAILITASGIMEMASVSPSAGSFYTYVTQGMGPHAGFITGGLMFLAYALLPPIEIALIGSYLQETIQQEFGKPIRHMLLPALGVVLMVGLFAGQIAENTDAPYTWMPWIILAWFVILGLGALWLALTRPDTLRKAGAVLGSDETVKLGG
jgi:amino acid transporter